jgi:hypothetical protein
MSKAFNQGWIASSNGLYISHNPFTAGTSEWKDWNQGYASHNSFKL